MTLIQGYLDGRLTAEGVQTLQVWIKAERSHAQVFARYCLLHSHMRDNLIEKDLQTSLDCSGLATHDPMDTDVVCSELMLSPEETEQDKINEIKRYAELQLQAFLETQEKLKPVSGPVRRRTLDWKGVEKKIATAVSFCVKAAAGLAIVVSLFVAVLAIVSMLHPEPVVVATIAESVQAQWAQEPDQPELKPGWMTLEEGFVRLDLVNGAKVVLQAPARINLETPNQLFLDKGRLVARAGEKGAGFTVRTPGASIVDFGTEFGVVVDRRGCSEAHVFEGEVDLRSGPNPKKYRAACRLVENEACSASSNGDLSPVRQARPLSFMRHVPSAYELAVLASSPVAYWRFERTSPTVLLNAANPEINAGRYKGPVQFTDGPVLGEGKKAMALHCDGQQSCALIQDMTVPSGEYTTGYTHVVWVRADVIREQAILCTNNRDMKGGIRSLAMTPEGRFEHRLKGENPDTTGRVISQTAARPGRWYHIAVLRSAFDDRKLFVNGVEEATAELSSHGTPRFQDVACLGAMPDEVDGSGIPLFQGDLSEVVIYNRALTAEEVRRLYQAAQRDRVPDVQSEGVMK
jgi:hypothetical protein